MDYIEKKELDEKLAVYLLRNGYVDILECPEVGCAAYYFKDKKLIYVCNVESIGPPIMMKVLNEAMIFLLGFAITDILPIDWIEHDQIIYTKIPDWENPEKNKGIKKFFELYKANDSSIDYLNNPN